VSWWGSFVPSNFKNFKLSIIYRKDMKSRYLNIQFGHFECDPDLEGSDLIVEFVVLCTWCHNGDNFCQIILKTLHSLNVMERT
jgi:hypothetical protein